MRFILVVVFLFSSLSVRAAAVEDLFFGAVQAGSSKGYVDTGDWATKFKKTTRSNENPFVEFTKLGVTKDDCYVMKMTAKQEKIPDQGGRIVGDYLISTKLVACQWAGKPKFDTPVEVLDCQIGGQSCMPKR